MSEIKVIMSCNIHSHKPRTIPKRWRLWIELLKAFPSGFAKQQSWLGRWRCEVFAAVMFHAASDAFSASPTLHLVNCVRFFHVLFQLPIGYETRDAMEKTSLAIYQMQLRSWETFAVFQRSKCRFRAAYISAWGCFWCFSYVELWKTARVYELFDLLKLWVVQDEDMRPHGRKRQCDLVSSSALPCLPFSNITSIAVRHRYL